MQADTKDKISAKERFLQGNLHKYIFGASTAVITNLGLISGLYFTPHPKMSIIGSILVVSLVDNISDTLGIHIYQEAEKFKTREVWISTCTNFFARFVVSLFFVLFMSVLPLFQAAICSIAFGLVALSLISYIVAVNKKANPYYVITEHLVLATAVIGLSHYLGKLITGWF